MGKTAKQGVVSIKLRREILSYLVKKLGLSEAGIRSRISEIRSEYPSLTLNAAASVFAKSRGLSIIGRLQEEDRLSLVGVSPASRSIITHTRSKKSSYRPKTKIFLIYPSKDSFQKRHFDEINRAYNAGCYTAVFILCRKVIENLIIDLLVKRFPEKNKSNRELYFDTHQQRFKDFSVILDNLFQKRRIFPPTAIVPIERLNTRTKSFAKDANDKTHSWYHIATKIEVDNLGVQEIVDLINRIDQSLN